MKTIKINEKTRCKLYAKYKVYSDETLFDKIINQCKSLVKKDQTKTVPIKYMNKLYIDFLMAKTIQEGRISELHVANSSFYKMAETILGIDTLRKCC